MPPIRTPLRALTLAVGLSAALMAPAAMGATLPTFTHAPGGVDAHIAVWGIGAGPDRSASLSVTPGQEATLPIAVAYDAPTTTPGPVTVQVDLPPGLEYVRADALVVEGPGVTARWACGAQGTQVTCDLRTADGSGPFPLLADHTAKLMLVVRASGVAQVAPGATSDVGTVAARVSVPHDPSPLTASTTVAVRASSDPPRPRIVVTDVIRPPAAGGMGREGYDLYVHDLGSGAATARPGAPSVVITGVAPPRELGFTAVTVAGKGWTCRPGRGTTCSYSRDIAHGSTAAPIKVRWGQRHDAGKVDKLWWIRGTVAYAGEGGARATAPIETEMELLLHDTEVRLSVDPRAPRGVHIIGGAKPRELHAHITNAGTMHASGASVRVTAPKGITVSALTPGWRCTGARVVRCRTPGALPAGATAQVVLGLSAPHHAETRTAELLVEPLGPLGKVRGDAHEVPVQVLDPGDPGATPTLAFRGRRGWEDWETGAVQTPSVGDAFAYRIAVTNSGSAPIRPGQMVTVRQRIGSAMGRVALTGGPGVRCDGPGVRCTITASRAIAPGATAGTIVVTTHPRRVGAERALGPIHTSVADAHRSVKMAVEVVTPPHSLRPELRITRDPTSGGAGSFVMAVQNTGESSASSLRALGVVPAGVAVTSVEAPAAWRCARPTGRRITCAYGLALAPGARTGGVSVRVAAAPGNARAATVRWVAEARSAEGSLRRGVHDANLAVRASLVASGSATPSVVPSTPDDTARRIALDGIGSTGSGMSLDYRWQQRCLTPADARAVRQCRGRVTPAARIDDATMASTAALLPQVSGRTTFIFSLTITDGSATSVAMVPVTAVPPTLPVGQIGSEAGLSPEAAARRTAIIARARGASRARKAAARSNTRARRGKAAHDRALARAANRLAPRIRVDGGPAITAKPGEDLALATTLSGRWSGAVTYEWIKASGGGSAVLTPGTDGRATLEDPPPSGLVVVWVIARDQAGRTAAAIARIGVGAAPSTQGGAFLIDAYHAARDRRPLPFEVGGDISGTLRDLRQPVTQGGPYRFARADARIGVVSIRDGSGTITNDGIQFSRGTLVLPSTWRVEPVEIGSDGPLTIAFATGTQPAALIGHARARTSFAIFPLPAGWAGTTDIVFAPGRWSVAANGVGDGTGTATVEGELRQDGTYRVDVRSQGLVTVGGTALDLSGAAEDRDGRVTSTVAGSAAAPIVLGDGVAVTTITATWAPRALATGKGARKESPVVIGGGATIAVSSGDAPPLDLEAALTYEGAIDWRLTLSGRGEGTWSPVPGLGMGPGAFTGFIGDVAGARAWDVTGTVGSWAPTSRLSMSGMQLDLTDECGDDPAPACPATGLFLRMKGTARLDAAGAGDVSAPAQAVLGMGPAGGVSLAATLPDLGVGPGMTITGPSLDMSYGMPADQLPGDVERPDFGVKDEGGYGVRVSGAVRIASLGAFDTVTAQVTKDGWALGGYARDGVALGPGNGRQDGAWFGWASYDASMVADVTGRGPQTVPIARNTVSVVGVYLAPDWFASVAGGRPEGALGVVKVTPAGGGLDGTIVQPGTFPVQAGAQRLTASDVAFLISGDASRGVSVTSRASAALQVHGSGGDGWASAPPLSLALSADAPTSTVTGIMRVANGGDWNDAFGVGGLAIRAPQIRLSVNTRTRETHLTVGGDGVLPQGLSGPLRVPATAPVRVGADLAPADQCVNVQVGDSKGSSDVMSLDGGSLRARYFEFVVAPTGCAQSKGMPAIPAGLALVFDGDVMGSTVDIVTPITLSGGLVLDAQAPVGDLMVGSLRLSKATVAVHVNASSGRDEVDLSGGVQMFGTTIPVTGPLAASGGTTSGTLAGAPGAPVPVSGFSVRNLALSVPVSYNGTAGTAAVNASADLDLMGGVVKVPAFTTTLAGGKVEETRAAFDATVNVFNRATARGRYEMVHQATANTMAFTGKVVFTTETGVQVGADALKATMVIDSKCATLDGLTENQFFVAQMRGTIAHAPGCVTPIPGPGDQTVVPQVGDYGFSASPVRFEITNFEAFGTVKTGTVGGKHFDSVATVVTVGTQSRNSDVPVSGTFLPNGHVEMSGDATVNVAGFSLPAYVTVKNDADGGAAPGVYGAMKMSVLGKKVDLAGWFTREKNGTRHASFTGALKNLSYEGMRGSATLTLIDTPTDKGFYGNVDISFGTRDIAVAPGEADIVGAVSKASGIVTFIQPRDGGEPLYHGTLNARLDIPTLNGTIDGTADFTNCDEACTTRIARKYVVRGKWVKFGETFELKVGFDEVGNFDFTTSVGEERCTGDIDIVVAQGHACIRYTIGLRVRSVEPYATFSASASADAAVRYWELWEWDWSPWYNVAVGMGASVQLDPFRVCVRIPVIDKDACI